MRTHTGRYDQQGNLVKPAEKWKSWNFLEIVALLAFLVWSAAGLIFTVSPGILAKVAMPGQLRQFVDFCQQNGDPILILLACINTHLNAVRQWTAGIARRWGAIVIVLAFAIETYGVHTGIPFGKYQYTENFGPMLGLVPFTIPLAWHVVVTNALFLVRAVAPHMGRIPEALIAAFICTAYDFILEPFATTLRHYWNWADHSVPPLNYVAWFAISAVLVFFFAPTASNRYRFDPRPILVLGLTLAIFITAELK